VLVRLRTRAARGLRRRRCDRGIVVGSVGAARRRELHAVSDGSPSGREPQASGGGDELIGLPAPPSVGATALVPGTFADTCVFVTGAGTGLGKAIASEFARL